MIRNNILAKRYSEKIVQLEKLRVDQLETQLKLLKMQYHPHFLFNALNTIYFLIDEENEEAIEAVELLSDLLRYQLYDINTKVTIEEEIDYLRTYIQFQRLRMTKRLQFEESFDPELTGQKIHPLLFQPLLENAFKYIGGAYRIQVSMRKEDSKVCFGVSGPFNEMVVMGVLAVRLSGLQGLHRELQWDGENMRFTNISPNDKIKIVTVDDFKVIDGDPRFDRRFAEFNAAEMANEWIKHTYNNGFSLPDMPR